MDRPVFVKSISPNISIDSFIRTYFDEIMALYNVVGHINECDIKANFQIHQYEIKFNAVEDAQKLISAVGKTIIIHIYGKCIHGTIEHIDNTLLIKLDL